MFKPNEEKKIGTIIQQNLMIVFLVAFAVAILTIFVIQKLYSRSYAYRLIADNVRDVGGRMTEDYDKMVEENTVEFTKLIETGGEVDNEWLAELVELNSQIISEINVVDEHGIVTYSSVPEYVGYDLRNDENAAEFLCLLNGTDYYVQSFRGNSHDEGEQIMYSGKAFSDGKGFCEFGISKETYDDLMQKTLADEVRYRRIGRVGSVAVFDKDYQCIGSTGGKFIGKVQKDKSVFPEEEGEYKWSKAVILGRDCYLVSTLKDDYYIMGGFPVEEAGRFNRVDNIINLIIYILTLVFIFFFLSRLLNKNVVNGIEAVNDSLAKITAGDLDEKADIRKSIEFKELSSGINKTVEKLKVMIEEADSRLDKELEMARVIQSTSLPNVFPPFPKRKEIGLFASMDTAKQVGGDFYDYYMLHGNILAVLIADVSDKGIPAALFMMKAKTVIKGLAVSGLEINEVVKRTNDELVKDNEADMFVTLWLGFIELDTGNMHYVHAGHTCPMLIRDGMVSMIKQKRNFIVGGRPGAEYLDQEYQLLPGDIIYLYTDGVTEAFDPEGEEYGNERLENTLLELSCKRKYEDPNELCRQICIGVREDVAAFAGDTEQSDDITMLCVTYKGKDKHADTMELPEII